jgi:hypothetical protein
MSEDNNPHQFKAADARLSEEASIVREATPVGTVAAAPQRGHLAHDVQEAG